MRKKLIGLIIFPIFGIWAVINHAQQPPVASHVSLVQLISNPSQYDNRRVIVSGFLTLEFENSALYLHADDAAHFITKNALWVTARSGIKGRQDEINHHYVQIVGLFKASDHGHLGMYSGMIGEVERIDLTPEHKW